MRLFFGTAGKISLALFLAGVGLLTVVLIYSATADLLAKKSLEKHAVAVSWTSDLSAIGLKLNGKRKYIDGALLVSLNFVGYPEYLSRLRSGVKGEEFKGFFLSLRDTDGFDVVTLKVPLSSLTTSVEGGKPIGLRGQSTEMISVERYARISQVKVGWDFNTEIPKPPSRTAAASSRSDRSAKGARLSEFEIALGMGDSSRSDSSAKGDRSCASGEKIVIWDGEEFCIPE